MATISPDVPRLKKTPAESGPFLFGLAPRMLPGATISNPVVASERQAKVTGSAEITPAGAVVSGQGVLVRLPAGTDEEDYLITVTADNSGGGVTQAFFLLQVRDAKKPS